jgi:hypothetical protein
MSSDFLRPYCTLGLVFSSMGLGSGKGLGGSGGGGVGGGGAGGFTSGGLVGKHISLL